MWPSWPQACITPGVFRAVVDRVFFLDRQRIDVGPQQHGPARTRAAGAPDQGRDPGGGDPRPDVLGTEGTQPLRDEARRLFLLKGEFWVLVQVPPVGDHPGQDFVDGITQGRCVRTRGAGHGSASIPGMTWSWPALPHPTTNMCQACRLSRTLGESQSWPPRGSGRLTTAPHRWASSPSLRESQHVVARRVPDGRCVHASQRAHVRFGPPGKARPGCGFASQSIRTGVSQWIVFATPPRTGLSPESLVGFRFPESRCRARPCHGGRGPSVDARPGPLVRRTG